MAFKDHIVSVPASYIRPGDDIAYGQSHGQVNRIETGGTNASGETVLVFPICLSACESREHGSGWRFPRYRPGSMVQVFAPIDVGGRCAELREIAAQKGAR